MKNRSKVRGIRVSLVLWAALAAPLAQAAKVARVQTDQAAVLAAPKKDAKEVRRLSTGTMIVTSNLPTEGFFKVRLSDLTVGWIATDAVQQVETERVSPEEAARQKANGGEPTPGTPQTAEGLSNPDRAFLLRAGAGAAIFSPTELDALFRLSTTHLAFGVTTEVGLRFTPRVSALLRLEYLTESFIAVDQNSLKSYGITLTGVPVLLGPEFTVTRPKSRWSIRLGAFGRISALTGFTSTSLSEVAPNVTTIRGTTVALYGRALVEVPVYREWNLAADLGYRFVKTASLVPSESGNGSEIFQSSGVLIPIATSLSGPNFQLLVSRAF